MAGDELMKVVRKAEAAEPSESKFLVLRGVSLIPSPFISLGKLEKITK
jgi:hypothetical protein